MRKHEDRQVWAGHFMCPPCATWRPWILWSPHSYEAQQEMLHETLPLKWVWREAPHCQERKELPTSQWKEPEDSGRLLLEDLSVSYICCLWTIITIASSKFVTTLSIMQKTACRTVEPKLCCNWTGSDTNHTAPLHLLIGCILSQEAWLQWQAHHHQRQREPEQSQGVELEEGTDQIGQEDILRT